MSREKILSAVKNNQPEPVALPAMILYEQSEQDNPEKFTEMLKFIGGDLVGVTGIEEIIEYVNNRYALQGKRILSTLNELKSIAELSPYYDDPHTLENVELTILKSHLGVAENGAVWITDDQLPARVLPFISEQLAVVLEKKDLVATLQEAYQKIDNATYGFGVFIAGPSKTSDIEQSLVLGAHGPKGMTVFLM